MGEADKMDSRHFVGWQNVGWHTQNLKWRSH